MPEKLTNAQRQKKFKADMKAKGFKQLYGIWTPNDDDLRTSIRKTAAKKIKKYQKQCMNTKL